MNHKLDHRCSRTRVAVVGCGGTGSAFAGGLPYIHQSIVAEGQPGLNVVFVDGDRISSTNCVRQPFSQSEIGLYKALVIANRLNLFWGLKWCASTRDFTEKTDGIVDILITCVDTRAARLAITRSPAFKKTLYWLDIGNNADTGQFVLGQPRNRRNQHAKYRLLTVAELYPEILDPKLDGSDTLPSCSSVEALKRQEPFVNQVLANHALALLARLVQAPRGFLSRRLRQPRHRPDGAYTGDPVRTQEETCCKRFCFASSTRRKRPISASTLRRTIRLSWPSGGLYHPVCREEWEKRGLVAPPLPAEQA